MSGTGTLRGTPKGQKQYGSYAGSSAIPRPTSEHGPSTPTSSAHGQSEPGASTLSASRAKQSKRDEAIRLKAEKDLSRRKHTAARARSSRKAPPGSVLSLKPSQALQIKPQTTVAEAAQLMAAKREDCVLVTDDDDRIAGIFTAKDLAFRVVGAGIKARDVTIEQIMTKNPLCAKTDTSATDALDLMVRKGFRHLPVMDENHDISGILDITKCFYDAMEKLERAYSSSRALYDALEGVQQELGNSQPQQIIQYVEALRLKMSGPTLESVLTGLPPATVSVRTTVKDAAVIMKENHTTAVLVQDQGAITGIFTSKDVVLRVIAASLDPSSTSVVRVMTPHPDFAPADMSIQAALRKMHDGHYLNLPVMSPAGEIVGMVDVLKLTYATLDQVNSMSGPAPNGGNPDGGEIQGPAWQKFWLSMPDNDTESALSGEGGTGASRGPRTPLSRSAVDEHGRAMHAHDNVMPHESASHHGADDGEDAVPGAGHRPFSTVDTSSPFAFKFKAPSGRVHRLQWAPPSEGSSVSPTDSPGLTSFIAAISSKLGSEAATLGGAPALTPDGAIAGTDDANAGTSGTGFALSYLDHEGDTVSITTARDVAEAVALARAHGRDKVDLFVHDPASPPIPATTDPRPGIVTSAAAPPTPADSSISPRKRRGGRRGSSLGGATEGADPAEGDEDPDRAMPKKSSQQSAPQVSRHQSASAAAQQQQQVVPGVPNELLLPGAIGVLAVVIVGVFAFGRGGNR